MANTPLRTVRIEQDLWDRAGVKADEAGESLSEVIRRALEEYAADGGPVSDDRSEC